MRIAEVGCAVESLFLTRHTLSLRKGRSLYKECEPAIVEA